MKDRMKNSLWKNSPWKKKTDAAWITTIAFLDQDNFPTTTTLVSAISLLVSIAMFFLMTYTTNSIGTDLVVVESPIIMKSYQDFIDVGKSRKRGEVVAGFCKLLTEYETYRDAPSGSLERQVFDYGVIFSFEPKTAMGYIPYAVEQRAVVVGRELFVEGIAYAMLKVFEMKNMYQDTRVLWVREDELKKYTNVISFNKKSDPRFQIEIRKILSRMFVTGLLQHTYRSAGSHISSMIMNNQEDFLPSFKRKVTRSVESVKPEMVDVALRNMKLLFSCFLS